MKKFIILIFLIQILIFSNAFAESHDFEDYKELYLKNREFREYFNRKLEKAPLPMHWIVEEKIQHNCAQNCKKSAWRRNERDVFIDRDGDGIQDGRHFRKPNSGSRCPGRGQSRGCKK